MVNCSSLKSHRERNEQKLQGKINLSKIANFGIFSFMRKYGLKLSQICLGILMECLRHLCRG